MDVDDIYKLSEMTREIVKKDMLDNITIGVETTPVNFLGLDKHFYYITHDNSYDGFVHSDVDINVNVDGVRFHIIKKE